MMLITNRSTFFSYWRAYYEICKPNVVALMLLTTIVGMCMAAPKGLPLQPFVFGSIGISLVAAAGAAFNHIWDQRYDALMSRTKYRPIPQGKIHPRPALLFALILAATGSFILYLLVNPLTAILSLLTMVGYAGIYTVLLKHATPQNIVIGGLAGAAPPLLGWTAITGSFDPQALLLVLIIFTWTPPHFWALAIHRHKDYAAANIPMLPVTHGLEFTKRFIFFYSLLLLAVSLLPYVSGLSGIVYLISSFILGSIFVIYAWNLLYREHPLTAMKTFHYSILYLMLLFVCLLADHYLKLS